MNQNYPSVKISTKDLRLFLRRINKCIRDLDSTLSIHDDHSAVFKLDPEPLQKLSDLIYCKAVQRIDLPDQVMNEDPEMIINELIN